MGALWSGTKLADIFGSMMLLSKHDMKTHFEVWKKDNLEVCRTTAVSLLSQQEGRSHQLYSGFALDSIQKDVRQGDFHHGQHLLPLCTTL